MVSSTKMILRVLKSLYLRHGMGGWCVVYSSDEKTNQVERGWSMVDSRWSAGRSALNESGPTRHINKNPTDDMLCSFHMSIRLQ